MLIIVTVIHFWYSEAILQGVGAVLEHIRPDQNLFSKRMVLVFSDTKHGHGHGEVIRTRF